MRDAVRKLEIGRIGRGSKKHLLRTTYDERGYLTSANVECSANGQFTGRVLGGVHRLSEINCARCRRAMDPQPLTRPGPGRTVSARIAFAVAVMNLACGILIGLLLR